MTFRTSHLIVGGALCALLVACTQNGPQANVLDPTAPLPQIAVPTYLNFNPLDIAGKDAPTYKNPFPAGTYEHFVAQPAYPKIMDDYSDDKLLNQITANNSKIIICLPQQRARLYVNGRVAMDWPVSTGTNGHETPTGTFRVIEKNKDHKSNRYGKFVNASGKTTDSNADASKGVPEGMTFQPAGMPNWHRLTLDGVGIHGGKVIPGRRLSHGCIRTPYKVAAKLFEYTVMGMPAYISCAVEDYNRGGAVRPNDVKYRPGGDHTDMAPGQTAPAVPTTAAPRTL